MEDLTHALQSPEADRELFQRLCNRHELRLVLSTAEEASRLTHAQQQAWGTSGLRPHELRAILHAMSHVAVVNGKPAVQFREQLKARVRELPPPTDSGQLAATGRSALVAAAAAAAGGGVLRL